MKEILIGLTQRWPVMPWPGDRLRRVQFRQQRP